METGEGDSNRQCFAQAMSPNGEGVTEIASPMAGSNAGHKCAKDWFCHHFDPLHDYWYAGMVIPVIVKYSTYFDAQGAVQSTQAVFYTLFTCCNAREAFFSLVCEGRVLHCKL